ncbi:hypothetical protein [Burkholderia ubonensis]|uniref:hypothetical protein n=1 Tax=Burkholderia ubonensis TaxID=101571 RepID=UPI00142E8C1A|nr:hypothetical protein [Burkholderia ubonensis]
MSDFIVVSGLPPFTPCQNYQSLPHPSEWPDFHRSAIKQGTHPSRWWSANFSVFRIARCIASKTCASDPERLHPL